MNKKRLRYAILKKIDNGENNFDEETFGITKGEFFEVITFLHREGYITKPMYGSNYIYGMSTTRITGKGENYLDENSSLKKGYKIAKEIKEWIKF